MDGVTKCGGEWQVRASACLKFMSGLTEKATGRGIVYK